MQAGDRRRPIDVIAADGLALAEVSPHIRTTSVGCSGTIVPVRRSNCGANAADRFDDIGCSAGALREDRDDFEMERVETLSSRRQGREYRGAGQSRHL